MYRRTELWACESHHHGHISGEANTILGLPAQGHTNQHTMSLRSCPSKACHTATDPQGCATGSVHHCPVFASGFYIRRLGAPHHDEVLVPGGRRPVPGLDEIWPPFPWDIQRSARVGRHTRELSCGRVAAPPPPSSKCGTFHHSSGHSGSGARREDPQGQGQRQRQQGALRACALPVLGAFDAEEFLGSRHAARHWTSTRALVCLCGWVPVPVHVFLCLCLCLCIIVV